MKKITIKIGECVSEEDAFEAAREMVRCNAKNCFGNYLPSANISVGLYDFRVLSKTTKKGNITFSVYRADDVTGPGGVGMNKPGDQEKGGSRQPVDGSEGSGSIEISGSHIVLPDSSMHWSMVVRVVSGDKSKCCIKIKGVKGVVFYRYGMDLMLLALKGAMHNEKLGKDYIYAHDGDLLERVDVRTNGQLEDPDAAQ